MPFCARTRSNPDRRRPRFVRPRLEELEIRLTPADTLSLLIPSNIITVGQPLVLKALALNAFGQPDSGFSGVMTVEGLNGPGSQSQAVASSGVATFTGPSYPTTGEQDLAITLSDSAGDPTLTEDITITVNPANLTLLNPPLQAVTAGSPFSLTLAVEDGSGNVLTNYSGTATLALSGGPAGGADLSGALTASFSDGQATFSGLTVDLASLQPGAQPADPPVNTPYTLTVTGIGLEEATTSLTVSPAAAAKLAVSTQPQANATAGLAFATPQNPVAVEVEDTYGNQEVSGYSGNLSITTTATAEGTLGGTPTAAVVNGEAEFTDLVLYKAGSGFTLQVNGSGLTSAITSPFGVSAATTPAELVVTTPAPASVAAGVPFDMTLAVADAYGNPIAGYGGTENVTLMLNNGTPLGHQAVAGGVAAFVGLAETVAGSYTVTYEDAAGLEGGTFALTVTAGPASKLAAVSPPATVTAGAAFGLTLQAEDSYGNPVASYSGMATLSLSGGPEGAALGGTATASFSGGQATFSGLTVDRASYQPGGPLGAPLVNDPYTLTATSVNLGQETTSLSVAAAAAAGLVVSWQPPAGAIAGQALATAAAPLAVEVVDAFGNQEGSSYAANLTIATTAATEGSLGGTVTAAVANGVAQFTDVVVYEAGTGFTLQVNGSGLTSAITSPFSVSAGSPEQLLVTAPATVAAGAGFSVTVTAVDSFGNPTGSNPGAGPVSLTVPGGPSPSPMPLVNGVVTFAGLEADQAGGCTIQASCLVGDTQQSGSSSLTVMAGPVSVIAIVAPPRTVTAGTTFRLELQAVDAYNNPVSTYGGSVTLSLSGGPGDGVLGGVTTAPISNGVASFSGLSVEQADEPGDTLPNYTLTATSIGLNQTETPLTVTAAAPSQLVVTAPPPPTVTAGSPFGLSVTVEDQYGNAVTGFDGNLAVAPTSVATEGALVGTPTVLVANGVAAFAGLSLTKSGAAFTLQVSAVGLTTVTTSPFSVLVAAASQLVVTTAPPSSISAGGAFGLSVTVADQYGNTVVSYGGAVNLTLSSGSSGGTLGGTQSETPVNGVATFSGLTVSRPGSGYTLTATSGTLGSVASVLNVTHATATQLVVTSVIASRVVAGSSFGLTVAAEDQYGNVDPTFTGSVTVGLASNPGEGILNGTTSVTLNGGVATFSGLTLTAADPGYQFQLTAGGLAPPSSSSLTFAVIPAAASQLVVTSQPPSTIAAGSTFGLTAEVEDQYGNAVTGFSGSLAVGTTNSQTEGYLYGTLTAPVTAGVAIFAELSLEKAGLGLTLQVSASGSLAVTTSPFTVTAGANGATQLVVTTAPPSSVIAGSPFGLTFAAEDQYGNVVPAAPGSVTLTLSPSSNPAGGSLGGTAIVGFNNGLASFSGLSIDKASNTAYSLQVASSSNLTASFSSPTITVTAALPTRLVVFSPPPGTIKAGSAFGMVFAAEDPDGNVSNLTGSVTVALSNNPGGGTLGGMANVQFSNGLAIFNGLTLTNASPKNTDGSLQAYSLVAASSGLAPPPSSSLTFAVIPAAASQLVVTVPPPSRIDAGSPFGLTVAVEDQYGNTLSGYKDQYGNPVAGFSGNLAVAPTAAGEGSLGGVPTVLVSNGVASFTGLTLTKPGTGLTLQVSGTDLPAATTSPFTVAAGLATQLVVTTAPTAPVTAGVGFGLTLAAEDKYGNVNPASNGYVTLDLDGGPNGATLVGTPTVPLSGGLATFSGLTLTAAGSGYSLVASSDGLTPSPSSALIFSVTAAPATQLVVSSKPPGIVTAGVGFGVTLAAEDQFGNVDPAFSGGVTLALRDNPGADTLGGTTSVSFKNGLAIFTGLTLNNASPQPYTLQAVSNGLAPMSSPSLLSVSVIAAPASRLAVLTSPPANVTAGSVFGFSVAAEDQYGNVVTSFGGSVTVALASNPGGGTLGGVTNTSFSNGLASFSGLTLTAAGSGYSLLAASNGLTPPLLTDTLPFNVKAAPATQLVVTTPPPANVAVGAGFGLTVAAEDQYGNVVTAFNGSVTVTLASNSAGGTLGGTLALAASHGVAAFSGLTISTAGIDYTLEATGTGLSAATTGSIDVSTSGTTGSSNGSSGSSSSGSSSSGSSSSSSGTSGSTLGLAVYGYPTTVVAGSIFDLSVAVEGSSGTDDTGFAGSVTLSLATNPGGATLGGNLTMPVIHGVVTFYDLSLNAGSSGYTIRAIASGADSATTSPITVTDPPATLVVTAAPPSSLAANQAFGLTVSILDASGTPAARYDGRVTITWAGKHGKGQLRGALTTNAVNGVATFSGLTLVKVPQGSRLRLQAAQVV